MKTESILKIIVAILPLLFLSSCSGKGDKYAFQYVTFKQTLPYEPGKENPRCNFDMRVLQAYGTDTMFADAFNKDISETLFNKNTTDVRSAMISFIDSIIVNFKNDNLELQEYAKQQKEINPLGIGYNYVVETSVSYGNNRDIIGCHVNWYEYTGGAHGRTFITCRNYRLEDGSIVTLDDYLKPGYESVLIPILDNLLLREAGCESRSELDRHGYFSETPMFVPDNFEIRKDSIAFIFNQYEIAPYSTGITTLVVPENDIRKIIR
jgi:hypothetical protein